MNCLLVDDEPGIREGLAALLRRKGHAVHTAGDCRGAAEWLAAGGLDLVITDWRLPDGTADRFFAACRCPVVAVSGHPEEVRAAPPVCLVLTKPVAPARLLEALADHGRASPGPAAPRPLPRDAAEVVAAVLDGLAAAGAADPATAELEDDGIFVVLRVPLHGDAGLDRLADLGGDLRVLAPGGAARLELRLCRDGRPDPALPVATPGGEWPAAAEFAVDFHDSPADPAVFARCLDRARAARGRGARVHFLNVPPALAVWATGQGRAHDMPMKEKVGPRLPSVLADLWS